MGRGKVDTSTRPPVPSGAWGETSLASAGTITLIPKGMTWKAKRSKNYVPSTEIRGNSPVCTKCNCNHAAMYHLDKDFTCSGTSGYRVDYPRYDVEMPERHKYPAAEPLTRVGVGHFETTNSASYKAPPPTHTEMIQQQQVERITFPFTATSTHRADFTPKVPSPRQAHPKQPPLPMLPLNGTSMTHEAFKDWSKTATRPKAIGPQRSTIVKSRFNSDTTYRMDFLPQSHEGVRSSPMRPPSVSYNPAEGFNSTSEYRHSFEPKPIATFTRWSAPVERPLHLSPSPQKTRCSHNTGETGHCPCSCHNW